MSSVTLAILNVSSESGRLHRRTPTGLTSPRQDRIDAINFWLESTGGLSIGHFTVLPDPGCPKGGPTDGIYYGNFNYLNVDGLLEFMAGLQWVSRLDVSLLTLYESDTAFQYHTLPDVPAPVYVRLRPDQTLHILDRRSFGMAIMRCGEATAEVVWNTSPLLSDVHCRPCFERHAEFTRAKITQLANWAKPVKV